MDIHELKKIVSVAREPQNPITIAGITSNSTQVKPNFLFIAERGQSNDGHDFINAAITLGASALLVERLDVVPTNFPGLVLTTKSTRAMAAQVAANFYGYPSRTLFCIGITGTNGKTSCTYLLEHLFNESGRPTGVIGTINHHLRDRVWSTNHTTPHPIEIQERLRAFVDAGAETLAIEVSSHALDQKRIDGIDFDVGIFTNLTRDHLDYHATMDEYFLAKQRFFSDVLGRSTKQNVFAIINNDTPWSDRIEASQRARTWTYGLHNSDFTYELKKMTYAGTEFTLHTPSGALEITSPLLGIHNIYNVMAATAAAFAGGLSAQQIEASIHKFAGIPGRLQSVPNSRGYSVLVDYAHSPDALENVLGALLLVRQNYGATGKIICVFGCGGDRDKGKRPLMAKIAERFADLVIVTSDNPRTEDPLQILREIYSGFEKRSDPEPFLEPDRAKAIALALECARPGDVVLIAGKGHEDYQIIGKEKFFFSDYETARKLLL